MPDQLERAVAERVAAHTPTAVPPFEAVLARKHRSDRHRGFAAVASVVAVVISIGLVPAAVDRLGNDASTYADDGAAERFRYHVRFSGAGADDEQRWREAERCLDESRATGPVVLDSRPPQYVGEQHGRRSAAALRHCVEAVEGASITLTRLDAEGDPAPRDGESVGVWALDEVLSPVRVRVVLSGGGCTDISRSEVVDSGSRLFVHVYTTTAGDCPAYWGAVPVEVELPRRLQDGERLGGECSTVGDSMGARYCQDLRRAVARRSPAATPP